MGSSWGKAGGRRRLGATLEREVLEEACARVEEANLLGFSKGECVTGPEKGLALVRSLWRADVSLDEWEPRHEIKQRLLVSPEAALSRIGPRPLRPISRRLFQEALGARALV